MWLLWWIVVGLVAGWLTGKVMGGGGKGIVGDILLGIGGALVGGGIMRLLSGSAHGGMIYTILVATGGAVLLTWLYRLITRGRTGAGGGDIRRAA